MHLLMRHSYYGRKTISREQKLPCCTLSTTTRADFAHMC